MTQNSSFKNWLRDFWLRCFGWEYIVEAEGKSSKKHDFRKCSRNECDALIKELNPKKFSEKCHKCKAILHSGGRFFGRRDRIFILSKQLYSPKLSWWVVGTIFSLIFLLTIYRPVNLPSGFSSDATVQFILSGILWLIIVMNFAILIMKIFIRLWFVIWLIFIIGILFIACVGPFHFSFYLVDIPTEQEWKVYQYKKEITKLERLSGYEKFEFALGKMRGDNYPDEWVEPARNIFLQIVSDDFSRLMSNHGDYVKYSLFFKDIDDIYSMYEKYLDTASDSELYQHCRNDIWNMFTPYLAKKYPKTWQKCQ
jgi:hypothetical protein